MGTEGFIRKITAIMSADVVGYSKLMGDDEEATVQTLAAYKDVMSVLINQHRGRVIDSPGDNMLSEFASVVDAVQCSVAIQKELKSRNAELPEDRKMRFRIGINLGDVIQEEDLIYGDGVNIAARLEALADPGGICVSKTAFDQIETKLPFGYECLGDQTVKNIPKPVCTYRVLMEPRVTVVGESEKTKPKSDKKIPILVGAAAVLVLAFTVGLWYIYKSPEESQLEAASVDKMAYPLPDKPSFAIMPFVNVNNDPELDSLTVGFTRTLIDGLTRINDIFVIAQDSTFTYKEKPINIKQVAEELSVQFVIVGSIQLAGDRLRITAQMIDTLKGRHVWSNRYDRQYKDILKIQDEITLNIIKTIEAKYDKWLLASSSLLEHIGGTNSLDAYLLDEKASNLWVNLGPDNYQEIKRLLEEAISLDPNYLNPYNKLTWLYLREGRYGFSQYPQESYENALRVAQKALEIDKSSAFAHSMFGAVYYNMKEHDKAIVEYKKAIELNPNETEAYIIGWAFCYAGRPKEAIPYFKYLARINPRLPDIGWRVAVPDIFMGKFENAIPNINKALEAGSKWYRIQLDLAACYAALGNKEEALTAAQKVLKKHPNFSVETFIARLPVNDLADIKPYVDALRKVPFPEN